MTAKTILQIIPAAPGWYARFVDEEGGATITNLEPIACFALIEEGSLRWVEAMSAADKGIELCSEAENFTGIQFGDHPPDGFVTVR